MPRYITAHIIACMPHQRLQKLLKEIQSEDGEVKNLKAYCDTLQGRMVCEFEAPDGDTLNAWLKERRMTPQWLFRVEFYAEAGEIERF
ncbi:MAG: hypothetical protein O3A46_08050 [Candidatus Poribacteria bacterium]|nr:hypothetical protein [Candidatus Poribacteria bacterium]